jgi:hypothetical protein
MTVNRCRNQNCEYFDRPLPNNAKVCPMCGTPVGNAITPAPPTRSNQSMPNVEPPPNVPDKPAYQPPSDYTFHQQRAYPVQPTPPAYSPPLPQRAPVLKLIHTTGREFVLPGETGYIGRRTQSSPVAPEIDLTGIPNEGIISRRHARVEWDWSQNVYLIVDMSTNGIYLNGNLLTPAVQYRLFNGDSLQLGQDNLVSFKVAVM